jgi:membrane-bound lytic murein transglycosylase A
VCEASCQPCSIGCCRLYFSFLESSASELPVAGSPFFLPENMVHQTINTNIINAASASSKSNTMTRFFQFFVQFLIVGLLTACVSGPSLDDKSTGEVAFDDTALLPPVLVQSKSRWVPVRWRELPGWTDDTQSLHDAWSAWLKSCEKPATALSVLCNEVRGLSIASSTEQRAWMVQKLQPYRVESLQGQSQGLLTSYFEPVLLASRVSRPGFTIPLYKPPAALSSKSPWYTRQEMDTLPLAKTQLRGYEIAYVADPIDALILHIQGSGRINMIEPDGSRRMVRLAFAGTNEQAYKSVGRWLLDQGGNRDVSWSGIKSWLGQNPQRTNELLWSNPRVVFFREEAILDAQSGPKGAQGVALTPGRSIAVDRASIPYGTPLWLDSEGVGHRLQKLVFAQDTGSAIVGAVRADYFAGWGADAGEFANRIKQPLYLWVLWAKVR